MSFCRICILAFAAILFSACSEHGRETGISLEEGWIRALPPGMKMTAGYGRFRNESDSPVEIESVESSDFQSISIHQTVNENGISKMRPVPSWSIGPGAVSVLQPGGKHLMLSGPARNFAPGDSVLLILIMADGRRQQVELLVEVR